MKKFEGMLICTDLDGTLLRSDKSISKENIEAIEYFMREGGYFTYVTGRMPFYYPDVSLIIKNNAPYGCINGGGLYDNEKKEYIWTQLMPDSIIEMVEYVDKTLPDVGIIVNTLKIAYFCKESPVLPFFREITHQPNVKCDYNDIKDPIAKIIFATHIEEEIEELERALRAHPKAEDFSFVRSEKNLFEILPKGIGKGVVIEKLCEHLGLDINKTVAIGDYNNDISMFRTAKIGVAVSNACKEALAAADHITVSNEEHAIARIIYDLDEGRFAI